ncbi:hypothetical protein [Bacillus sp. FJAT-52991]|uniref:Uncharacterized protein n=1 Tax=Bacillus kandeliae TaxID=3129297 RepID=A0ABZ2N9C1_9BACI
MNDLKRLLVACRQVIDCLPGRMSKRKLKAVERCRTTMQAMGNAKAIELIDAVADFGVAYNAGESWVDVEQAAAKIMRLFDELSEVERE